MSEVYLIVFDDGEVHSMNDCPSPENLKDDSATYIKITHYPENDIKLEYYNGKDWTDITP
jgi:hypothetical protein